MKRFLALLLALAMLFCLAACGEKTPDDNKNDGPGKSDKNDPAKINNVLAGMSIADVDALLTVLSGQDPGLDIENVYFEVGASDKAALLGLGAKLLGEQHDIDLFMGESFVLSAPSLLDKNYGLTMEGMKSFMEGFMNGLSGSIAPGNGSAAGMLPALNSEAIAGLVTKYYDLFIDELKKAEGIEVTTQGDKTVINGNLTPAGAATVVVNLTEELSKDDDFFTILGAAMGVSPDEAKQNLLEGKPDAATLITQLTDGFSAMDLSVQIKNLTLGDKNIPMAGELSVSLNQEVETDEVRLAELSLVFDLDKSVVHAFFKDEGTELFGLDIADGKLDLRMNIDGMALKAYMEVTDSALNGYVDMNNQRICQMSATFSDTALSFDVTVNMDGTSARLQLNATESSVKGYLEMDGEKMAELDITISDSETNIKLVVAGSEYVVNIKTADNVVTGTLTMDGQEMGKLVFGKKVSGSKTTYTVKTLTVEATTLDLSAAGISFYIDTDANIPAIPSFTDINTLTQDELAAIGDKFLQDNADLVEWISGLMPGPEEGYVGSDYYAA